jgi:DNA mismatch repair protein MutS2
MNQIKVGDFVTIDGQETIGEVISIRGNNIEVALGLMKVTVKLNKVSLTQKPQEENRAGSENTAYTVDTKEKMMNFQFELDVRGKTKEDVMVELMTWTDDAILLGVEEAKIIHGRGNGILKNTVRSMLRKYKEIETLSDDERGGDGVTVVKFKIN